MDQIRRRVLARIEARRAQDLQQYGEEIKNLQDYKTLAEEQSEEIVRMEAILEKYRFQAQTHAEAWSNQNEILQAMKGEVFACLDILNQLKEEKATILREKDAILRQLQDEKAALLKGNAEMKKMQAQYEETKAENLRLKQIRKQKLKITEHSKLQKRMSQK